MTKDEILQRALEQATNIATGLVDEGVIFPDENQPATRAEAITRLKDRQIIALIYLQKLGAAKDLNSGDTSPSSSPFDVPDRRRDPIADAPSAAPTTTDEQTPSS